MHRHKGIIIPVDLANLYASASHQMAASPVPILIGTSLRKAEWWLEVRQREAFTCSINSLKEAAVLRVGDTVSVRYDGL